MNLLILIGSKNCVSRYKFDCLDHERPTFTEYGDWMTICVDHLYTHTDMNLTDGINRIAGDYKDKDVLNVLVSLIKNCKNYIVVHEYIGCNEEVKKVFKLHKIVETDKILFGYIPYCECSCVPTRVEFNTPLYIYDGKIVQYGCTSPHLVTGREWLKSYYTLQKYHNNLYDLKLLLYAGYVIDIYRICYKFTRADIQFIRIHTGLDDDSIPLKSNPEFRTILYDIKNYKLKCYRMSILSSSSM